MPPSPGPDIAPTAPTPVAALRQLASRGAGPPLLVTFSAAPAAELRPEAFGAGSAFNLVMRGEPLRVLQAFGAAPGAAPAPMSFAALQARIFGTAAKERLLARFVDAGTPARFLAARRGLLRRCAGLLLEAEAVAAADALAELGFQPVAEAGPGWVLLAPAGEPSQRPAAMAEPAAVPAPIPDHRIDRLVILDPCLEGARGHYLPLALAYTRGAQALGAEVAWACHARFDGEGLPPGVALRRCFARSFFDLGPRDPRPRDLGPELAPALRETLEALGGPGTHALAHSADPGLLRAALLVAQAMPALPAALHLCIPNHPWQMPFAAEGADPMEVLAALARTPQHGRSIFLWAETRTVAGELGRRLGLPVPVLRLPAPAWADGRAEPPAGERLALAFLGEARLGKGFLDLPELAAALEAAPGLAARVELRVHALPPHDGFTRRHRAALDRLAGLGCVTLREGRLDDAGYRAFVGAADAVLLPYDPRHYNGRGTGILCDALAAGRAVVARAGATMAEHAEEGVVLLYRTPAEFVARVAELAASRAGISAAAMQAAPRFIGRRNAVAVVASLRDRLAFAPG